jgi:hypothetical protein
MSRVSCRSHACCVGTIVAARLSGCPEPAPWPRCSVAAKRRRAGRARGVNLEDLDDDEESGEEGLEDLEDQAEPSEAESATARFN